MSFFWTGLPAERLGSQKQSELEDPAGIKCGGCATGSRSGAGRGGDVDRSDAAGTAFRHCVLCPPTREASVWLLGSV